MGRDRQARRRSRRFGESHLNRDRRGLGVLQLYILSHKVSVKMTIETSLQSRRRAARLPRALSRPKLITILSEGYGLRALRADIMVAASPVAIVALPLSMAIAIASGTTPERGLYTAIVGGFLVSALGGSRFQIGGPAGAFIVLVAAAGGPHMASTAWCWRRRWRVYSADDVGYLRLGALHQVHSLSSDGGIHRPASRSSSSRARFRDLFGLTLAGKEPGEIVPKLIALAQARRGRSTSLPWRHRRGVDRPDRRAASSATDIGRAC